MRKKLILSLCGFILLTITIYLFSFSRSSDTLSNKDCPFCNPLIVNKQNFYEDDLVLALYTHKPIMPGHCLIIPKRHVERFEMLSDEESVQICRVIRKVNLAAMKVFDTFSYLLLQKNGHEAGQTVPHVHFHYVPRKTGDDSALKFVFKMFLVNMQGPIKPVEMHEAVEKLKQAIEQP